jgi:hypothetical protein
MPPWPPRSREPSRAATRMPRGPRGEKRPADVIGAAVRPKLLTAAMSRFVIAIESIAIFPTKAPSGRTSPAFWNAARRLLCDAVSLSSSVRSINAWCAGPHLVAC